MFDETGVTYEKWPCWQTVDVNTGEIVWNETDLLNAVSTDEGRTIASIGIREIEVSPDGGWVALQGTIEALQPRIMVVELLTGKVYTVDEFNRFEDRYWASPPG